MLHRRTSITVAALLCLVLAGCFPTSSNPLPGNGVAVSAGPWPGAWYLCDDNAKALDDTLAKAAVALKADPQAQVESVHLVAQAADGSLCQWHTVRDAKDKPNPTLPLTQVALGKQQYLNVAQAEGGYWIMKLNWANADAIELWPMDPTKVVAEIQAKRIAGTYTMKTVYNREGLPRGEAVDTVHLTATGPDLAAWLATPDGSACFHEKPLMLRRLVGVPAPALPAEAAPAPASSPAPASP